MYTAQDCVDRMLTGQGVAEIGCSIFSQISTKCAFLDLADLRVLRWHVGGPQSDNLRWPSSAATESPPTPALAPSDFLYREVNSISLPAWASPEAAISICPAGHVIV